MAKMLIVIVLVVIAVMTLLWALGKILWWLRVTFPPARARRRPGSRGRSGGRHRG